MTSSPSSIAIRDILCSEGEAGCEELQSQAFLALATAAVLGLWVELIGDVLARKDRGTTPQWPEVSEQLSELSVAEVKGAYELDFAVVQGSMILGHTPKSAGLCHLPGVMILRLSRCVKG